MATDAFGNVYLGGDNYADQGANTFVSKYDSSGDLRWTSLFGTEEDDSLNDIVSDERGNIFLVGSTWGDLGAPNAGLYDAYLAKVSNIPEPSTIFLIAVGAITVYWTRQRGGRAQILILLSIALVSMETTFVAAAQFIPLGFPSGEDSSISHGISPDGEFIVGSYSSSFPESFRWDELGSFESLGDLPVGFTFSQAHDASVQGEVVVGTMENEFGAAEAFRWTSSQGIVGLGVLPEMTGSLADAVSADGAVVVGSSFDDAGDSKAFRWTEVTGIEELDFGLQPSDKSRAFGVSADGLAVVGSNRSGPEDRGFHWTHSQGVQLLNPLPGDSRSAASGISADGSVFVGESVSLDGNGNPVSRRAVRWNGGGVAQDLGTLFEDDFTVAIDASADGSVIIGMSQGDEETPFLWTEVNGMRPLVEILNEAGLDLTGWDLRVYNGAISDDGNSITGWGRNPDGIREGWVARLNPVPEPSTITMLVLGTSALLVRHRRRACSPTCARHR